MAGRYRRALSGPSAGASEDYVASVQQIRSASARIFWPSSTAWKWTCRRISARRTWRRSTSIATASRAPSGGCRCGCSACREDDGILLAHHLGRALQLTNILRDIDEDAAIGRLYLPREGCCTPASPATDPHKVIADPALPKVCAPLVERARMHFEKADEIMDRNPRRAVRAPRIMSKYYRAILELLVARGFALPRAPVRVEQDRRASPSSSATLSSDAKNRPHHRRRNFRPVGSRPAGQCGFKVHVHEATQQAGGRCRSYFDAATNLTIDNGNHLLLSGNRHALAYARSIGTEAGLVGPQRAQFPFVDLATGQRWQLDLGDGRLPLWIFDEARRVPDTGLLDYLALMPLIWASNSRLVGDAIPCKGRCIIGWCSRCCSRRSTSIRPRARRASPARWCGKPCWRADRPAGR